jgi:putative ABC transport system permease protein
MPNALSLEIAAPDTLQTSLTVPASQVKQAATDLGAALPGVTVINLPAYAARFTQAYRNLFVFAVAMASLAILAGILLVANSVSLAMLDRRYEIGVLKAVGYARRQVLFTLVVEYSLVALIATGAGLLVVQIFLTVIAMMNDLAGSLLVMSPIAAGAILLSGVVLTLLTVLAVTWRPVQVSPVIVLNDRN